MTIYVVKLLHESEDIAAQRTWNTEHIIVYVLYLWFILLLNLPIAKYSIAMGAKMFA